MLRKLILLALVVLLVSGWLITAAISSNAKTVLTVSELLQESQRKANIRLGALVNGDPVYSTEAERIKTSFRVTDTANSSVDLLVVYTGAPIETLQKGRGVIVEGDYEGGVFLARVLMTKCPSKYESRHPLMK